LDGEVAEPGADVHPSIARPMYQFEGDYLLAGEPEHRETVGVIEVNSADLLIAEDGIEVE